MAHALAVDIGGTELRAAVVGQDGVVRAVRRTATDAGGGPAAVIAQIEALLASLDAGTGALGLGLCAPGPLDPAAGIAIAPPTLTGWQEVPLAALLAERLGLAVRIENDANAAALGEWRFGAGRGTNHMVFVTVSTGIGGGVIADGRLLYGRRGFAAEVGHMTIAVGATESLFGGPPGSFEALASGTALGLKAARVSSGPEGARLRALAEGRSITAREVVAGAREGDPLCLRLLDEEAKLLGIGFANLLQLYAPECLIVGGGLGAALDLMGPGIAAAIQAGALPAYRDTPIIAAALGADAGLVGAASLLF